jgi:hypothetical protein
VIRYRSVLSSLCGFTLILTVLCLAAYGAAVRVHSEAGWEVPGLKQVLGRTPERHGNLEIQGISVQYKSYKRPALKPSASQANRVLFLSQENNVNYITWHQVEPRSISTYETRGRMFAVMIEGVIRQETDPKTGEGGTGGEVRIAYQDVDGSGKFKLAIQNLPADFRPEVPAWVKK